MGLFDQFPYTNFHELNLDWILKALKELEHTIEQFVAINALKYADPIQWNITSQYEKNTIVIDPQSGTAYISVQPVPSGVALTNEDYWTVVFDLGQFVVRASKNFANTYEAETTLTATVSTAAGGWLIWGDTLYKALVNITAGDSYVIGGNIAHFTMEDIIGHLEDLTTTDKSNLIAAINEVVTNLAAEALARETADGNLEDLTTEDKSNLVGAINEVADQVLGKIGDLEDLTTTDKSNLVAAISEVDTNLKNLHIVSVKDFGAVGDGVTDDEAAFNRWLNYIGDNGYIGFIPNGTYFISTQTVTYRNETGVNYPTIIGESIEGTILKADPNIALSLLDFRHCGARIENLTLDCNDSGSITNPHFGLYFESCSNVIIKNVKVINVSYCGVMAYSQNAASYCMHFHVNNLTIIGTGKDSVGDNVYPMGCIFENTLYSDFTDITISNVCKYAFEFKDYCYRNNVDGITITNTYDGIYFGGNANEGVPPTGFYCNYININNYIAYNVDYPIFGGYNQALNFSNCMLYGKFINGIRFHNSRHINGEVMLNPTADTTSLVLADNTHDMNFRLHGNAYNFAGYWLNCMNNTHHILLELMGYLDTTNATKVVNPVSNTCVLDYRNKTKYNFTWTDGSYT